VTCPGPRSAGPCSSASASRLMPAGRGLERVLQHAVRAHLRVKQPLAQARGRPRTAGPWARAASAPEGSPSPT
jgi:hypothetical protein